MSVKSWLGKAYWDSTFIQRWTAMLRNTMEKTGNGYRLPSIKHTGIGDDRRADKLKRPMPKALRQHHARYAP